MAPGGGRGGAFLGFLMKISKVVLGFETLDMTSEGSERRVSSAQTRERL